MPRRDDEFTPDPFENEFLEKDPTATELEDPIEGIDLSDDFYEHEHQACPVDDPRAAYWQEHSFFRVKPEEVGVWQPDWCLELARFRVPPGRQGRVSVLETSITAVTATPGRKDNESWMFPNDYQNQLTGDPLDFEFPFRFYLRLESWKRDDLPGAARTIASRASLPGVAYPPLGEWHDARYDYVRQSKPSLLVTEGHYLTLWCEIVIRSFDRLKTLWGRLGGITQIYRDNPQAINAARGWPQL